MYADVDGDAAVYYDNGVDVDVDTGAGGYTDVGADAESDMIVYVYADATTGKAGEDADVDTANGKVAGC